MDVIQGALRPTAIAMPWQPGDQGRLTGLSQPLVGSLFSTLVEAQGWDDVKATSPGVVCLV